MNQTAETGNETLSPIYLKEVFKSKNPALARWIPGFVYSCLNRIICIDDINDFIRKHGDRKGIDFADAIFEYLNLTFQTEGIKNMTSPQ